MQEHYHFFAEVPYNISTINIAAVDSVSTVRLKDIFHFHRVR